MTTHYISRGNGYYWRTGRAQYTWVFMHDPGLWPGGRTIATITKKKGGPRTVTIAPARPEDEVEVIPIVGTISATKARRVVEVILRLRGLKFTN